jgi:hypothetical protein
MPYGSNGFNSNGSCMNVNNQISARPGIRVYAGIASGGSYGNIFGAEPERQASQVYKQVQQEKRQPESLAQGQRMPEPAPVMTQGAQKREPVERGLRRRTVIDASGADQGCSLSMPSESQRGGARRQQQAQPSQEDEPAHGIASAAVMRAMQPMQPMSQAMPEASQPMHVSGLENRSRAQHPNHPTMPTAVACVPVPQRKVIDCSPPSSGPSSQDRMFSTGTEQKATRESRMTYANELKQRLESRPF